VYTISNESLDNMKNLRINFSYNLWKDVDDIGGYLEYTFFLFPTIEVSSYGFRYYRYHSIGINWLLWSLSIVW